MTYPVNQQQTPGPGRLERPRRGRLIAGVCAGLADYFGVAPSLVRVLAVVSCLLPGPQFLAYLVLWLVMPAAAEQDNWTPMPTATSGAPR